MQANMEYENAWLAGDAAVFDQPVFDPNQQMYYNNPYAMQGEWFGEAGGSNFF